MERAQLAKDIEDMKLLDETQKQVNDLISQNEHLLRTVEQLQKENERLRLSQVDHTEKHLEEILKDGCALTKAAQVTGDTADR